MTAREAFCDLHCHLLWGLDDGAKDLAESLGIARELVAIGFQDAAPSPHNRPQYAPRELALARLEEVRAALDHEQIPLVLHANSENAFVDDAFVASLGTAAARTIGRSTNILVEAPYSAPMPSLLDLIFRMKLKGMTPVIAHPERCLEFDKPPRTRDAVNAGALLQLDVSALVGRYGARAQKLARTYVDERLYAIAGTDVHSLDEAQRWVGKAIDELFKRAGDEEARRLLGERPRRLLSGVPLES